LLINNYEKLTVKKLNRHQLWFTAHQQYSAVCKNYLGEGQAKMMALNGL